MSAVVKSVPSGWRKTLVWSLLGLLFGIFILIAVYSSFAVPEIVAHRGSSDDAPENTVAAALLAWERGADAVEVDIHRTADGRLVVLHDEDTGRTTGVSGLVSAMTLEEIRALDAGSWKDAQYAGERIPLLDEILVTGGDSRRFFIEIKQGAEVVPALKKCLEQANLRPEQAVIISFSLEALRECKKQIPQHPALWLQQYKPEADIGEIIKAASDAGLDGLDLDYRWPIDAAFVGKVSAARLGLWVWTVDDADIAKKLAQAGVKGITTNRPGWMRHQLGL